MRRKNLQNNKQSTEQPQIRKQQNIVSNNSREGSKIGLQKPESGTQQKLVFNQSGNLNKQKLQLSLNRTNPSEENSQSVQDSNKLLSAATIKTPSNQKQLQSIEDDNNDQQPNKKANEATLKIRHQRSKLQYHQTRNDENSHSIMDQSHKKGLQQSRNNNMYTENNTSEEETAETLSGNVSHSDSWGYFLKVTEKLVIDEILGIVNIDSLLQTDKTTQSQSSYNQLQQQQIVNCSASYFIVKSRFHNQQKLISRQRIIIQQPLKLIGFYQQLIMQNIANYK